MAMVKAEYGASQTNAVVVPATGGKIILVLRLLVSGDSNFNMRLQSDPGGADDADLTPTLYVSGDRVIDLKLGRAFGLAAGRGKALGLTSDVAFSPADHSVMVWYELVD